ncbi:MAG TPA: VOC family protein [Geminicoccaceae bacterium]|nr:VOC family protein [Geminicoccaceae bacterium]
MSAPTRSAAPLDMKLEVVVVPVADVDRAKQFYLSLGWRLDADFAGGEWRIVQMTPTGSAASFFFGKGLTRAAPGSAPGLLVMVDNVDAARAELLGHGVEVSEVFHFENNAIHFAGPHGHLPGPDPERRSYFSFAEFSDPDGNGWLLQEITTRFPGRGLSSMDVATLVPLLREAEERHGKYEPSSPKHHWSDWYAAYLVARERGKTPDLAAKEAAAHIEGA